MDQDKKREGINTEIREGMTVYGLMLSRDGYFVAEGTVSRIDGSGFHVKYKILPTEMEYRYEDIGEKIYTDRDAARNAAEVSEYEKGKAEKEDFAEQNTRPFGKIYGFY